MRPRAFPLLAALLVLVALGAAPFRAPAASVQEASPAAGPAATPQRALAVVDEGFEATARAAADAADATAAALGTALAGTEADLATAEARQEAAGSAATALAATAAAQGTALAGESGARATAEAGATEAVGAAAATAAALGTALAGSEAARATTEADLEAARATAVGREEALARAAEAAAAGLDPGYRVASVEVDAAGVVAGDEAAIADARRALARALAPYGDDCRVGVVLTFGHAATIDEGVALAEAVNRLLPAAAPGLFDGAALDAFGDLGPPPGQVDLRLYFFAGCPAATPQATPLA